MDSQLMEFNLNSYQRTLRFGARCPLPPELLLPLKMRIAEPFYSKEKAEVWGIGIILLGIVSLIPDYVIYDWEHIELNGRELIFHLDRISRKYSTELLNLIKICLEFDPDKRADIESIIELLAQQKKSN